LTPFFTNPTITPLGTPLARLAEQFKKITPIPVVAINQIPPLTSRHDMIMGTRIFDSQGSGHDRIINHEQ